LEAFRRKERAVKRDGGTGRWKTFRLSDLEEAVFGAVRVRPGKKGIHKGGVREICPFEGGQRRSEGSPRPSRQVGLNSFRKGKIDHAERNKGGDQEKMQLREGSLTRERVTE